MEKAPKVRPLQYNMNPVRFLTLSLRSNVEGLGV
jgi:hypothetical protein